MASVVRIYDADLFALVKRLAKDLHKREHVIVEEALRQFFKPILEKGSDEAVDGRQERVRGRRMPDVPVRERQPAQQPDQSRMSPLATDSDAALGGSAVSVDGRDGLVRRVQAEVTDSLHPANAQHIRDEVGRLEHAGRFNEASILRDAYPEAFVVASDDPLF